MRLTTIRAVNARSFEDLTVDVDAPLTVFVGPNGAGKTNVFRVVRAVLEGLQLAVGNPDQNRWNTFTDQIRAWRRDDDAGVTLECGVRWDRADERAALGAFIRGVLVNMQDMARHIGNGSSTGMDATAWAAWVDALPQLVSDTELAWLFDGTLGVLYTPDKELLVYYRPATVADWLVLLRPVCGIVRELPAVRWTSHGNIPLTSLWMQGLSEPDRTAVATFFTHDGPAGAAVPAIPFHWADLLAQMPAVPRRPQDPRHVVPLGIGPYAGSPLPAPVAALYADVGLDPFGIEGIALPRVLNQLLRDRIVISEDLLSPPADHYNARTWATRALPLTSRHLGAHLLALKVGDDAARARFAAIQATFQALAGRTLDVTSMSDPGDGRSATLQIVQRGAADRRSTPLIESGSGLIDLAYLSALWHVPASHILLLDEPGRSLHPQALIRMRRLLEKRSGEAEGAQILAITHSAFVVPTADLGALRLVRSEAAGPTQVWALRSRGTVPPQQVLKQADRWGRSVNWPALLFSNVVLLVDGESEWAALPVWYERMFDEPFEASGITLLFVGGKSSNGPAMADLDQFHIPWVALIDGDSLKPGSDNIWRQLQRVDRLCKTDAKVARRCAFADAVDALRDHYRVFVAGTSVDENFDTVIEGLFPESDLPPDLQVADRSQKAKPKVARALWAARKVPAPPVVADLFACVRAKGHGEGPD